MKCMDICSNVEAESNAVRLVGPRVEASGCASFGTDRVIPSLHGVPQSRIKRIIDSSLQSNCSLSQQ